MKTRWQLWLAGILSELLNMQSLHELLLFAFCILQGIRTCPHLHYCLYFVSHIDSLSGWCRLQYFFVFSSTTWNIQLCNYFSHCHTSDSLSGRGRESPLPVRSALLIGFVPDHYRCKELIKTDHYRWSKNFGNLNNVGREIVNDLPFTISFPWSHWLSTDKDDNDK